MSEYKVKDKPLNMERPMSIKFFRVFVLSLIVCFPIHSNLNASAGNESEVESNEWDLLLATMSTFYVCRLNRGPNWTAEMTPEHERLQTEHVAFLHNLMRDGTMVFGGPFIDGDHERGLAVFRGNSLGELEEIMAEDPKVLSGHLTLEWKTWLVPKGLIPERTYLNKTLTGKSIEFDVTVDMPVSEVFSLWSTADGAKKFFALDARIEPIFGGKYEIIFNPESDPEGKREGTYGARILQIEKNRALAFEWTMPPFAASLNSLPLPTWIELRFDPANGDREKTHISISHLGFGQGEKWDEAFDFFQMSAWPSVLKRLTQYCNEKIDPWR
jgi:uncharacterized protein YndB with AHSA1/START domain/uncharacterized protein YciI